MGSDSSDHISDPPNMTGLSLNILTVEFSNVIEKVISPIMHSDQGHAARSPGACNPCRTLAHSLLTGSVNKVSA